MRVNTKVHESMIDQVSRGLPARIRVDAAPNEPLTGTVESVAPLPDPTSFFSSDIKVYTTLVTIDKGLPALRPGMSAEVEILIDAARRRPERAGPGGPGVRRQAARLRVAPDGMARRREVKVGQLQHQDDRDHATA